MKKRVFISGITGNMGREGLAHLLKHSDHIDIVSIVRPSKKNKKAMRKYKDSNIEIVWGDLTSYRDVKLVYIGSVAQTGDRLSPIHWGRVGDPIKPSIYDHYAVTKIAAERMVIE